MAQCLHTQCDMKATRQFQKFRQRLLLRNPTRVLLKSGRPKGYTIAVVLTLVVLVDYQVKSQNNRGYQNNTSSSGFDLVDKNGQSAAVFDAAGKMKLPTGYRKWVFVGAPLTPNALNNGKANFPEYHHVYVEQKNVDAEGDEYERNGYVQRDEHERRWSSLHAN